MFFVVTLHHSLHNVKYIACQGFLSFGLKDLKIALLFRETKNISHMSYLAGHQENIRSFFSVSLYKQLFPCLGTHAGHVLIINLFLVCIFYI